MTDLPDDLRQAVWNAAHQTPAVELGAKIGPPGGGGAAISGLDGLLVSPALVEDFFRRRALLGRFADEAGADEERLRSLAPGELADLVWRRLFLDRQPLSEAARAVLTTLGLFGIDVSSRDIRIIREQLDKIPLSERWEKSLRLANLELVLYPVECLDAEEAARQPILRPGCRPLLSLSRLFGKWRDSVKKLRRLGFGVKTRIDDFVPLEIRRHLAVEISRLKPTAISLAWPGEAALDGESAVRLLREAVLPLCRERKLALLLAAGANGRTLPAFWKDSPDVRFLLFPDPADPIGGLAAAAGARNLLLCDPEPSFFHPSGLAALIGCRLETVGTDFHAYHSGAVCPEELAGRWAHLRWTLGKALIRRYEELWRTGWRFSGDDVGKDVEAMLNGNAKAFIGLAAT